ncbi:YhcH/YjgK/YiaL family protein [Vibrio algarum]|uniref:YhcH/YjgK/YiaL family protein n=1 Tax=Vibrio algarum TaxID=3020714 RepID=A0ABT4YLX7_9VIBR|nr:YhcH/YjgK/YiaL family protein [Vibrio sp. KJ40-1]MDB1122415.1 YhcH/YjgK/YiaL family protein [Vibrio sp. KJ40-1]
MAIFGNLEILKDQIKDAKFDTAFEYLGKAMQQDSEENLRLTSLPLNAFNKIELNAFSFALEQVYNTKIRSECFFESHKKYIDVQFILDGEEIIAIKNVNDLKETFSYDESIDLIKYSDSDSTSCLILRKGDVAIFYPEDAHMPGMKVVDSVKVVKTVVKVRV